MNVNLAASYIAELRRGKEGVGVGANRKERSVTQVKQASETNHDIKAEGKQHVLGSVSQLADQRSGLHAEEWSDAPGSEVGFVVDEWQNEQQQQDDTHYDQRGAGEALLGCALKPDFCGWLNHFLHGQAPSALGPIRHLLAEQTRWPQGQD